MSIYPDDALLPCPFCGGKARAKLPASMELKPWSWIGVACDDCRAVMLRRPTEGFVGRSKYAMEAWNQRAERTCHIIEKDQEPGLYCSECGALIEDRYCSHCGAKVVEHD